MNYPAPSNGPGPQVNPPRRWRKVLLALVLVPSALCVVGVSALYFTTRGDHAAEEVCRTNSGVSYASALATGELPRVVFMNSEANGESWLVRSRPTEGSERFQVATSQSSATVAACVVEVDGDEAPCPNGRRARPNTTTVRLVAMQSGRALAPPLEYRDDRCELSQVSQDERLRRVVSAALAQSTP